MNKHNLIPNSERTAQELKDNGRKGGIKSAETRRERKTFKELLHIALQEKDRNTGEENAVAMVASLINRAKQGDNKAFEIIRDTIGEKPIEKHDISETDRQSIFINIRGIADNMDKTTKAEVERIKMKYPNGNIIIADDNMRAEALAHINAVINDGVDYE